MDSLVTTDMLAREMGAPDLVILDCSMFMAGDGRDPAAEYAEAHIPGARFLDIEALSDHDHPAPHMLPDAASFGAAMEALGVGRDDRIVVYDNSPLRSATRGWFMLRHYGADRIAILDGGLAKWKREGRQVEGGPPAPRKARFDAIAHPEKVVGKADILDGVGLPLADARGAARFDGSTPDPRPGIAPGHIPGACNLPYTALYRDDGTLKSDEVLAQAFADAGLDPGAPFVASCGSGVTATSLLFAAYRLGATGTKLYDGSWSEWGADPATPKEMGPAR